MTARPERLWIVNDTPRPDYTHAHRVAPTFDTPGFPIIGVRLVDAELAHWREEGVRRRRGLSFAGLLVAAAALVGGLVVML